MAKFPYPEYRNLWRGSKLSKDRSSLSTNTGNTSVEQTNEGLEITTGNSPDTAYSMAYTNGGFRVDMAPGLPYSFAVPIKNTGPVPFSTKVSFYMTTGGIYPDAVVIQPGETYVFKAEGAVLESGGDLRFSVRYDTNDPRPPDGAKITILDGVTCVQSETVPPFLFNGDGLFPVETLKRRNLAPYPRFQNGLGGQLPNNYSKIEAGGSATLGIEDEWLSIAKNGASAPTAYVLDTRYKEIEKWAGRQITVGATLRLDSPPANPDAIPERNLYFGHVIDGAYNYSVARTDPITALGETRASFTVNIPANAQAWFVRFMGNNADGDDQKTFWSYLTLEYGKTSGSFFDGDSPASGNLVYRYAPDGTSLEIEVAQPPTGRTTVWDGEPYKSTSTLWVGDSAHATGVMEISASTDARLGIVADVYSRSREKIQLELARVDSQLIAGERVELDAAAMTASPVVWHWRQITGPTVELEPREASMDFIAPDVNEDTPLRIAVYAASEDGRNRSDWHYFDLTIKPPIARFRATEGAFSPVSPKYVGYDRGKREIWNDVIPPSGFSPNARHETEIIDLGILPDDVQFTTGGPPEVAAAGGIYVDLETGDIYRNFGAGYNETDDTTAAPRTNAWWVNPATGDILEWIED